MPIDIRKKYLPINPYSRPGIALNAIRAFIIHWEANPNTSALANWRYFKNRKYGNTGYGAAQYIMDPKGFVIQCMPDWEMAYQVGSKTYTSRALRELSSYPNNCVIGLELPHIDWEGRMTSMVYDAAVKFTAYKCKEHNLSAHDDVWLHQEVVGWKDCHRWFVNHSADWRKFKGDVDSYMRRGKFDLSDTWYLARGDHSEKVGELQRKLKELGYYDGAIDNNFGPGTERAVEAFQADNNLDVDGSYGPATQAEMKEEMEDELTVNQYKELKDEIKELKAQLNEKMDTTSSRSEPSDTHEDAWKWLISEGITNGATPLHYITREQVGTMLKRYNENNEYLPAWMYDDIVDKFDGVANYLQKPDEWKERLSNHEVAVPELLGMFFLAFLNKDTIDQKRIQMEKRAKGTE